MSALANCAICGRMRSAYAVKYLIIFIFTLSFLNVSDAKEPLPDDFYIECISSSAVVDKDGNWIETRTVKIRSSSDSGAQQIADQKIPYDSRSQTVDLLRAWTEKADGEVLELSSEALAAEERGGASSGKALGGAVSNKTIQFRNVTKGDAVAYTVKITVRNSFPGQFSFYRKFANPRIVGSLTYSVSIPKSLELNQTSHGFVYSRREQSGRVEHIWRHLGTPRSSNPVEMADGSTMEIAASSFRTYEEFAAAYRALFMTQMVVTPEIISTAEQITGKASSRKEKIERIYNWVSTNIRYKGGNLSDNGVIPHDAAAVLAARYGDCKDHAIIFGALLSAIHIESDVALINSGNVYSLIDQPMFGSLNHVITWLPSEGLFVDTTNGTASIGVLRFETYGKPVVMLKGARVWVSPSLHEGDATVSFVTRSKLDIDGTVSGATTTTATGPFGTILKDASTQIDMLGAEDIARKYLSAHDRSGWGTYGLLTQNTKKNEVSLTGTFKIAPSKKPFSGEAFPISAELPALQKVPNLMLGLKAGLPGDNLFCFVGEMMDQISLEIPAGYRVQSPHKDVSITNVAATFSVHWQYKDREITVVRRLKTLLNAPKCGTGRGAPEEQNDVYAIGEALNASYHDNVVLIRGQ